MTTLTKTAPMDIEHLRFNMVEQQIRTWEVLDATVLDLLLRDVFPELRSVAERRDRLAELWGELPLLLARLDAALQRRAGVSAHLSKLIEEAGDRG